MRHSLVLATAIASVGGLAWWDAARESQQALEDFATSQASLAESVAVHLSSRLNDGQSEHEVVAEIARMEQPQQVVVLVRGPGNADLLTSDGRRVIVKSILEAFSKGSTAVRLNREEAVAVGLPERMAIAGLSRVSNGWGLAVVTSAMRQRDRDRRATTRLALSILVAAGVVAAFAAFALNRQRLDMLASRRIALAEVAWEQDLRLQKLSQAATMLTMASGVAHEIATPLAVIVGRAEQLLLKVVDDDQGHGAVRAILEQAESIDGVVRGFLDLARGGAPELHLTPPATVGSAALRLVEHRFLQANVSLAAELPASLPALRCEPRLLQHVLTNLLLNACDACSLGGHVKLTAEETESCIRFTVVDDGAGIAPVDVVRAKEPFFTTKPQGTGLGLAIANEIAKSHRGWLTIERLDSQGTRAIVQIPLSN